MTQTGGSNSRKTRWHIWRIRGATNWVGLPTQQADTAEEAIELAVENEIRLHPISEASGMYFACPLDMLTRRDWAVSYEKRQMSKPDEFVMQND